MAQQEIVDVRSDALRRAVHLTLQESDDFLRMSLSKAALPHGEELVTVCEVVRSKLAQLYDLRLEDETRRDQFNRIVDGHLSKLPTALKEETASNEADLDGLSWDTWIDVFRAILHDLCDVLGLPGDFEMKVRAAKPAG